MRITYLLAFLTSFACSAQQTSVLFIGNSYTEVNDLPNTMRQLALSLGSTVTVGMSAPGGYTFTQHATYAPTLAAIASQPWDFVVMQEQSQLGALPPEVTDTESGAVQLVTAIEANYECTYPVFYMTWGRQNGDDLNCPNFPFMCTYDGMQQGLRDNYIALADYNDAYTAPVGVAWKMIRDSYPAINLYQSDGSHPSAEGTYLAACVFYCTLFQQSCTGASFLSSLPQATATILQTVASNTVLNSPNTWNLDVANGTDAHITGSSSNGPNEVTYYHPGVGTHLWTCSDGQSSTDANPTFYFLLSGSYTMTHTYMDPCGNTDTVSWNVDIIVSGVEEQKENDRYQVVQTSANLLEVRGAKGTETLTLFDAQGRVEQRVRLDASVVQFACSSGLHTWLISDAKGRVWKGKIALP